MNFAIPRVFVVPVGNSLPVSGTTATLTPNQFGLFLPSYAPATSGNIAAAEYFFAAQGRNNNDLNMRSIKSDKIYATNVKKKYKITSEDTARVQISEISDLVAHCGETISFSIRLLSNNINRSFYNGLTRTYTISTPCCECDGDPCAEITADQYEDLVDEAVTKINADVFVNRYASAYRTGTGTSSALVVSGKAPETLESCDLTVNSYEYDGVLFRMWAYKGAPTTQDQIDFDSCESIGTYTVLQTMTYPRGSSDQVALAEKRAFSYTVPQFKQRFADVNFNGIYHSNVVDGQFYDQYVIYFVNPESPNTFTDTSDMLSMVTIFVPPAQAAALEAILEAGLGTFEDASGADISTTTTSTSSSTTSTTTTV